MRQKSILGIIFQNSRYVSKIFCYCVIIQAIEEGAITRLQKYLKAFRGARINFHSFQFLVP